MQVNVERDPKPPVKSVTITMTPEEAVVLYTLVFDRVPAGVYRTEYRQDNPFVYNLSKALFDAKLVS